MVGGSPPPSLLEATNNTTRRAEGTFTSQPDSSVCRESDWYVEQYVYVSYIVIDSYTTPVNIRRLKALYQHIIAEKPLRLVTFLGQENGNIRTCICTPHIVM